ncbi:Glucan endo-1-3-beta-glucosidase 5 [Nymphaea thermarum]|nr:Glucan endo-1-3-beta-glucosidase 5 [Nymphaea thermarum]
MVKLWVFFACVSLMGAAVGGIGVGVNWGTQATHLLPPKIVVQLLKDNGIKKVKLFEADPEAMKALGNSGIQVMLGVPNDFLAALAGSVRVAENWVVNNVSHYVSKYGVDVRYVAVGNEPFLKTFNGTFQQTTFPALQNVQAALIKAGLSKQVKVTVPLNADVYQSSNGLPSGGDFRPDIHDLMLSIIQFLSNNGAPFTINIYPFLSLNADPNFPTDFAFFDGGSVSVVDGTISYTNVFDANHDTLIWALEKNGFPSLPVIVGEVGWPTDGAPYADSEYAKKFNQGFISRISNGQGTPKRPGAPDAYLFSLIDEDMKSVAPGNFERHWGLFYYDGSLKYSVDLGNGQSLVPARGVKYLARQWCVLSPTASIMDSNLPGAVNYACSNADCTSLGYGSSCGGLDARGNASYAFNRFYQTQNQQAGSCDFSGLSVITQADPSEDGCRFDIMINVGAQERSGSVSLAANHNNMSLLVILGNLALIVFLLS